MIRPMVAATTFQTDLRSENFALVAYLRRDGATVLRMNSVCRSEFQGELTLVRQLLEIDVFDIQVDMFGPSAYAVNVVGYEAELMPQQTQAPTPEGERSDRTLVLQKHAEIHARYHHCSPGNQ